MVDLYEYHNLTESDRYDTNAYLRLVNLQDYKKRN